MNRRIVSLMALMVSLTGAQTLKSFEADIYPEYYTDGVMVEYLGELEPGSLAPAVEFMVPAGTDSAFSVQQTEDEANPVITLLPLKQRGGETWVSVIPHNNTFRFFAFYTPFPVGKGTKSFSFAVKSSVDFPHYHILVQKPMMAENFTLIEPDDEPDEFPDQHGITFYRFHYDALAAGQEQSLEVRYDNPTGQHTMDVLTSMMNSGGSGAAAGANTSTLSASTVPDRFRLAIWQPLAALLVMALIVGLTYPRFGSVPPKQVASVNRNTASGGKSTARTPKFCSQCGSPVQPRDKFCSHCGHKL